MSDGAEGSTHFVSEGGVTANHPLPPDATALVAPAIGNEFNRIIAGVIPIACWRVNDLRFEFDSSFVRPEIETELQHLTQLVKQHPGCPLSVFGHADPVGNDDYNKLLSGRRATAIYALLTRTTSLWEELYSQPLGNDKWGSASVQTMSAALGETGGSGNVDQARRQKLFLAYMNKLCGPDLKLTKSDFLGRGADAGGKGDYQGCGEFNPVLVFSRDENAEFEQAKDKAGRDAANAPNRRVMVLLFRKGSRVDAAKWPCPRVKEAVAGCRKRFWSDGEKRRSFQEEHREFQETEDTFACRFYDRLVHRSPCEGPGGILSHISVLLRSNSGAMPLANLPYKIRLSDGIVLEGKTDADGFISHPNIAPGDYPLELNGVETDVLVPTLPTDIERCAIRVAKFFILKDDDVTPVGANEDIADEVDISRPRSEEDAGEVENG